MAHKSLGVGDEERGSEALRSGRKTQGSHQGVGGGVKLPQGIDTPGVTEFPWGDKTPGATTARGGAPRED